jgi:hypothetical protein
LRKEAKGKRKMKKEWQWILVTILTQAMLFYKAVTTKNPVTEIICVVLIAALSPSLAHFFLRVGKGGIEFVKEKLAALSLKSKT